MKTIVLDDDPTGTQSATGVRVLLECSSQGLEDALRDADSVYVQTNSRALHEAEACEQVARIRRLGIEAARRIGEQVRFVLRGDSTLRGHVFSETGVFLEDDGVMLYVPAFPDGGRTTRGGVHYVRVDGSDVPAHETEYAQDPVFPFGTSILVDYVAEKSSRAAFHVPLAVVRGAGLDDAMAAAPAGSVLVPDAQTNLDIALIAAAVERLTLRGAKLTVRCAAPLAAELAGVPSTGLLRKPLLDAPVPTLLVCGSHTAGATAQLARVEERWGPARVVRTDAALDNPTQAGTSVAEEAVADLEFRGLALVSTERVRSAAHGTLEHGTAVMSALISVVRALEPQVGLVISKGGITAAEVATVGLGAASAWVIGQILPGVSVWQVETASGRDVLQIVVPGNVGGPETLAEALASVGY